MSKSNASRVLAGKHALITGGGTGIGAAIAMAMANQGAVVTVAGRYQEPLDEMAKRHENIRGILLDVTDAAMTEDVFAKVTENDGPPGIVVANAGIAETLPIGKSDLAFWRRTMAVNLDGAFLTMRAAVPGMLQQKWGRIIAVSSTAGQKGMARGTAYCASKHGLIGLSRALAEETLRTGITVNALCPGFVRTAIIEESIKNITSKTGRNAMEAMKVMMEMNPIGRLIKPDEVAQTALWLCGPGSEAISGQTIQIAGGHV